MHYSAIRFCIFLSLTFLLSCAVSEEPRTLDSLRQLGRTCFPDAQSCVLLLNEKGSVGCAQCGKETVTSSMEELEGQQQVSQLKADEKDKKVFFAVESVAFQPGGLLRKLQGLRQQIADAVVIQQRDPSRADTNQTEGEEIAYQPLLQTYSSDTAIPNRDYIYKLINDTLRRPSVPLASDLQHTRFPFNVFSITANDSEKIEQARDRAEKQNGPEFRILSIGRMDACPSPLPVVPESPERSPEQSQQAIERQTRLQLQTNSSHCLSENTCMPVGGYSVWSTSSLMNESTFNATEKKPEIVAVTAPMDSSAFFHDLAYGSATEIASVAAMMAVAKSVGDYRRKNKAKATKHPMFFAFNAQAWGFAGSGRFLDDVLNFECKEEMSQKKPGYCSNPVAPSLKFKALKNATLSVINLSGLVSQTDDVTLPDESGDLQSIGSNFSFYVHGFRDGNKAGTKGDLERVMISQFQKSNLTLSDGFRNASFTDASQSFQEYYGDADVVSLTNFQGNYSNRYYHSIFDKPDLLRNESLKPLYAVARAVAKSVIQLCFNDANAIVEEDSETIFEMIWCLTTNWKERPCTLAKDILGEEEYETYVENVKSHNYAGVFTPPDFALDKNPSGYRKSLFLQRLMAYYNRLDLMNSEDDVNCTKSDDCDNFMKTVNPDGTNATNYLPGFCAKGKCVIAESHLHAAFGTGLQVASDDNGARSKFVVPSSSPSPTVEAVPSPDPGEKEEIPPGNAAWTESNWEKDPQVCYTVVDTMRFGGAIFGAGFSTFVLSLLLSLFLNPKKKPPPAAEQDTLLPEANDLIDQP